MTEIRSLTLVPPAGEWHAVSLREAASPDGPWESVQARAVSGGSVNIAFRPRVENGFYKAVWVAEGGTRAGVAEGPVQRLPGASASAGHGPVARIGDA